MKVNIERIKEIKEEIRVINEKDLTDLEFFENGVKLQIDKKIIDEYKYIGLNNVDFIMSGFYYAIEN